MVKTVKELNRQKVPRKLFSDGINLKIYKRYGWEKSTLKNEIEEFKKRRDNIKNKIDKKYLNMLDELCLKYEFETLNKNYFNEYSN